MPKPGIGGTNTNRTKTVDRPTKADIMKAPKRPARTDSAVMAMLAQGAPVNRSHFIDK